MAKKNYVTRIHRWRKGKRVKGQELDIIDLTVRLYEHGLGAIVSGLPRRDWEKNCRAYLRGVHETTKRNGEDVRVNPYANVRISFR